MRLQERDPKLERYSVNAITGGTEAQGEVSCMIRDAEFTATGQGVHTDIIMASALAYINALNKLEQRRRLYGRASETTAAAVGERGR